MKILKSILCGMTACLLITACSTSNSLGGTVNLSDYLEKYADGDDATLAIRMAVEDCKKTGATELVIPEGTYNIYPDLASEKYAFVTNNSADLKRFAFDLSHLNDFTIEGNGATLLLHQFVSAFTIDTCTNLTINNLKIDYDRTFHSEGTIVRAGDGWVDLKFPDDYITQIYGGTLHFRDSSGTEYPYSHLLEFNAERKEPEFMASDYWLYSKSMPAEKQPDGTIRVFKENLTGKPGNIMVLGPSHRLCPAIAINESNNINIKNIDIYHCGGMGVVAQHSSDITLEKVNVEVKQGANRMISATADATHFTHCEGKVNMIDCRFYSMLDDATNIHGMYGIVKKKLSPNSVRIYFPHDQQYGLDIMRPGREAEMLAKGSLITYDTIRVKEVTKHNKSWYDVTFDKDIAAQAADGDLITEMSWPEVLIKGCSMGNNRARGLLLGSKKKTVVEDCYFHIPGAAILFEGDGCYWFEQAGVRDVTIRNNHFDNGNFGYKDWGNACIATGRGPDEKRLESLYNRNITIEGNTFTVFDPRILNLYSADNVVFRNNKIEKSDKYAYMRDENRMFITDECSNVSIDVTED